MVSHFFVKSRNERFAKVIQYTRIVGYIERKQKTFSKVTCNFGTNLTNGCMVLKKKLSFYQFKFYFCW